MFKTCFVATLGAALLMTSAASSHANTMVVDFDDVTTDQFDNPQQHQGFEWTFDASGWFVGPGDAASCTSCISNGTSFLTAAGPRTTGASVVMVSLDASPFSLFSLDAATQNTLEINQLEIVGTFQGGGTITEVLDIDGVFTNHSLSGFEALTSVEFTSVSKAAFNFGGFAIDNLVVVPEPSSLALMLLAILGFFHARRGSM